MEPTSTTHPTNKLVTAAAPLTPEQLFMALESGVIATTWGAQMNTVARQVDESDDKNACGTIILSVRLSKKPGGGVSMFSNVELKKPRGSKIRQLFHVVDGGISIASDQQGVLTEIAESLEPVIPEKPQPVVEDPHPWNEGAGEEPAPVRRSAASAKVNP